MPISKLILEESTSETEGWNGKIILYKHSFLAISHPLNFQLRYKAEYNLHFFTPKL